MAWKTSYLDFILWYFGKCWEKIKGHIYNNQFPHGNIFSNELLTFTYDRNLVHYTNPLDKWELKDFSDIKALIKPTPISSSRKTVNLEFNSEFFKSVVGDVCEKNWVDIENFYYEKLKYLIKSFSTNALPQQAQFLNGLNDLNTYFEIIKNELEIYLTSQASTPINEKTLEYIYEQPISKILLIWII
ncbi:MAG: hypothetical protein IPO92_19960 [Saprospiraceae bacterium]|nr:hypothetical protein [Saprospiraceae bacterium]